ncbi:MAG: isochorismatase family protein [Spirochaetaceae bacterium]|nr:MAG: isochorismatase family protein [Spirochaetaceae bacterium]
MKKTALVLIDLQNDYFPGGRCVLENSLVACQNAKRLLLRFRELGSRIIHIQHESNRPDPAFFAPGTDGMKIKSDVAPVQDEKVILKHKPSSFIATELQAHLEALGIKKIILAGMQTNVCVKAFVIDPQSKSYDISIIHDALAAATKEIHVNTLPLLARECSRLISTDDLLDNLK